MPNVKFTGPGVLLPSGGDTKRSTTAEAELGQIAYTKDGAQYIYVKAGATIAVNDAVRLQATLADVRPVSAVAQMVIGIATAAFASGEYGFVYHRGGNGVVCKLAAATAANALLTSSGAAAGTMLTSDATAVNSRGAVCSVAESGGTGTVILY